MRDKLANALKHRGSVCFIEVKDKPMFRIQHSSGEDIQFSSDFIEPLCISIDNTIDLLVKVHNKLLKYVRKVVRFANIFDVFEVDESGRHVLDVIRDKTDYCPIS